MRSRLIIRRLRITADNFEEYFEKAKCCNCGRNGKFLVKKSIELGPMGYLLKDIEKNSQLICFLKRKYQNINIEEISMYVKQVLEVSE